MATNEIANGCGLSTEAVLASNHKRSLVQTSSIFFPTCSATSPSPTLGATCHADPYHRRIASDHADPPTRRHAVTSLPLSPKPPRLLSKRALDHDQFPNVLGSKQSNQSTRVIHDW